MVGLAGNSEKGKGWDLDSWLIFTAQTNIKIMGETDEEERNESKQL